MPETRSVVIAGVVATAALVGGWLALPRLQSAERTVNHEVAVHVERARRLLHQYNPSLTYAALVRDQLRASDVDVDATDPAAIADRDADTYQAVHEALWTSFQPTNWAGEVPRPDRPSYGNISSDVRSGVRAYSDAASANRALLDDALSEVSKALAVSVGDASGRSDADANQLKAMIVQQLALADAAQAALKRGEATWFRGELTRIAADAENLQKQRSLVADSGIESAIADVRGRMQETQTALSEKRGQLADLERQVSDLEARKAAAENEAEQTRVAIERLEEEGVSFADPQGAEAFAERMKSLAEKYAAALRRAHMLEHGGYPLAEIDYTGDFLRGRYLEDGQPGNLTVEEGLKHLRLDRDILAKKVAIEEQALQRLNDDLTELEQSRDTLTAAVQEADARSAELTEKATEAHASLNRVQSEAFAIEESALNRLDEAAGLMQQAARLRDQWTADARQQLQNVKPEAQSRSAFQQRTDDGWMSGQASAETAGVRLAKAWVFHSHYRAALRDAEVLERLTSVLPLDEVDAETERAKAADARENGIDEVKQAMAALEKAHRGLDRHWTVAAQAAGTVYLLALFGESDYVADAIQHYRNAIKGRESEPFVETFATRLAELEQRSAGSATP